MAIPKLSKVKLKYVSEKQQYNIIVEILYGCWLCQCFTYAASEQSLLSTSGSSSSSLVSSVLLKRHRFPAR